MKGAAEKATKEAFAQVQKSGMKDVGAEPDKRVVYGETMRIDQMEKKKSSLKSQKKRSLEAPKDAVKEEDVWSQDQQKQLELALREFPASMEAQERWTKIAEKVGGKTKKQCVDRFKVLRDAIKKTAPAQNGK